MNGLAAMMNGLRKAAEGSHIAEINPQIFFDLASDGCSMGLIRLDRTARKHPFIGAELPSDHENLVVMGQHTLNALGLGSGDEPIELFESKG